MYEDDKAVSYDIDLLENTDLIDDDLKQTILGERRKIVFVEGVEHSLDKPLYSLLFPNSSIVPKEGCRDVENAVVGIKSSAELHWVKPFGLVDNDTSEPERIAALRDKGVIPINVYSVESIYYHPELQRLAGEKLSAVVGGDLTDKLYKANDVAIQAIRGNIERLSARIAEKQARALVFSCLPKKGEMESGGKRVVEIDFKAITARETARLDALLKAGDFIAVLQRYPIRETPALDAIARALNFAGRAQYEEAVRRILAEDERAVDFVRNLLGTLPAELIN